MAYQKFSTGKAEHLPNEAPMSPPEDGNLSNFSDFSSPTGAEVSRALSALRPRLVPQLAVLPDPELLTLVRHAVEHARERTRGRGHRYCTDCGLRLSVIAVSYRCGFCGAHVPR